MSSPSQALASRVATRYLTATGSLWSKAFEQLITKNAAVFKKIIDKEMSAQDDADGKAVLRDLVDNGWLGLDTIDASEIRVAIAGAVDKVLGTLSLALTDDLPRIEDSPEGLKVTDLRVGGDTYDADVEVPEEVEQNPWRIQNALKQSGATGASVDWYFKRSRVGDRQREIEYKVSFKVPMNFGDFVPLLEKLCL